MIFGESGKPDTAKRAYQNQLDMFYEYSKIVKDLRGLITCPSDLLQKELEGYCMHMTERVKKDEISANSVERRFTGIKNVQIHNN